jgi:flagellar hook-length control protein FliK
MKTPAILISTTISPGAASAAKPSGDASSPMFNQVLSREMAERAQEPDTAKPAASDTTGKTQGAESPKSAAPAEKSTSPDKPKSADKSKSGDKGDSAKEASEDDEAAASSAPSDLLALVASLNQATARPAQIIAGDAAGDAAQSSGTGKRGIGTADLLAGRQAANPAAGPHIKTAADPDAALAASAQDAGARENDIDFAAAMRAQTELRDMRAADAQPNAAATGIAAPSALALNNPQAAAGQAADKLTPRVGAPGWDQALGQKMVWMAAGSQQSATLSLNPPDLGPLQVVLNVTNNHASVNFTAAQPEVRQALEASMPKLRDMLADAGIQLGQTNVSAGTPNHQQGGFSEQHQASRTTSRADGVEVSGAETPVRAGRAQIITGGRGMVDTFA